MANVFKAKKILSTSGIFSSVAEAPNLVYNTGNQAVSGVKNFSDRPTVNGTGVLLSGEAYSLNNPSGFITGVDLSNLYPRSNPSGFITGVDTSSLYPRSNPSGFITGVDTSSLYPRSNPSGFITGVDTSNFYTKDNPSGFINNINVSDIIKISMFI